MQIEFQNTFEDFRAASKAHRSSKWSTERTIGWIVFLSLAAVVWICGAAALWQTEPKTTLFPFTPIILGAWSLFVFVLRRYQFNKVWRRSGNRQFLQQWDITESSLKRELGPSRSESKWSLFHRYLETSTLVLLYVSDESYYIVPKRAFADSAQLDEFRDLLRRHIHPQTNAFPVISPAKAQQAP